MRNNEQIYSELKKANEKYLNQRVENSKLKDEINVLQGQIDQLHTKVKKLQQTVSSVPNSNHSSHQALA